MSKKLAIIKAQLTEAAHRAYQRGIQTGNGGNVSARVPGEHLMVVKPSGVSLLDCSPKTLIITDFDGNVIEGNRKPTRESVLHGELYKNLPKVGGVVHTHSPWSISWSFTRRDLPLVTLHAQLKLACAVPVRFFASPNGVLKEEMPVVLDLFAAHPDLTAFVMGAHGIVAVGPDVLEAEHTAELIEETAQIAYLGMSSYANASAAIGNQDAGWMTREALGECSRAAAAKGYVVGTWGSISARCGDVIYILAGDASLSEAAPNDFVGLDLDSGRSIDGTRQPSAEALMHLVCYRKRSDIQAVIHTHPSMSIAVACCGLKLHVPSREFALFLGDVGQLDCLRDATTELAGEVESAVDHCNAILLGDQGVLTVGANLKDALIRTELVEQAARIMVAARSFGVQPLPWIR